MTIWVRSGTASVDNGSNVVNGTLTVWGASVQPGNAISFDGGSKWYEIAALDATTPNVKLTLVENFAETTITNGAYAIQTFAVDRTPLAVRMISNQEALIASQTDVIETTGEPDPAISPGNISDKSIAFDPVAKAFWYREDGAWIGPVSMVGTDPDLDGTTGSTDNALLRSDGTGGGTVQGSTVLVDDNGVITVPENATPATPSAGKMAIYAKSDHVVYSKDSTGAEKAIGAGGGSRNRVINPCARWSQAGFAAAADGAYSGFDQWYVLTQTGTVLASQLTNVADGLPTMMRLTQSQATAQRFGWAQVFESSFVKDLRGKTVTLAAKVRMSASTTLRYAIVEWTGTADTVTKDIVADWTKTTFTAGQFFAASSLTIASTGSIALTSGAVTDVSLTAAAISTSMNNLIVFFWTDSTQAQNVTIDLGNVFFGQGASAPLVFDPLAPNEDLYSCLRYYQKVDLGAATFVKATGFFQSTTSFRSLCPSSAPMRVTPTFSTPSGGFTGTTVVRYDNGTAITISSVGVIAASVGVTTCGIGLSWVVTGGTAGALGIVSANENFIFDARL